MPISDVVELERLSIWGRFCDSLDKDFVYLVRGYYASDFPGVAPLFHCILVSNIQGPGGVSACQKGFVSRLKIESSASSNPTL